MGCGNCTVNPSLAIQPLNVEPLHPTASKVGKEWSQSAAVQQLLSMGARNNHNSRRPEKRPFDCSRDDPNVKQVWPCSL